MVGLEEKLVKMNFFFLVNSRRKFVRACVRTYVRVCVLAVCNYGDLTLVITTFNVVLNKNLKYFCGFSFVFSWRRWIHEGKRLFCFLPVWKLSEFFFGRLFRLLFVICNLKWIIFILFRIVRKGKTLAYKRNFKNLKICHFFF